MGKHLAEQLVAQRAAAGRWPAAIVRPSFVVGVAAQPYAGYVGNLAGPGGFGLAFGLGFLQVRRCGLGPAACLAGPPSAPAAPPRPAPLTARPAPRCRVWTR
jgi:hypothetical protein